VLPYVLILCSVACAKADDIVGNLLSGDNGQNGISSTTGWAVSFTMGSNAYTLSDVQIDLVGIVVTEPTFELESDDGAPTNDVLVTFEDPNFGLLSGVQTFTFLPEAPYTSASPYILTANTTYWLVAIGPTSAKTGWANSSGAAPTGEGATYGGRDETSGGTGIWGGAEANINLFEVDGTADATVPEPGSGGLAIIGLALFLLATGRKTLAGRGFWAP
jgi:hypothetical protein